MPDNVEIFSKLVLSKTVLLPAFGNLYLVEISFLTPSTINSVIISLYLESKRSISSLSFYVLYIALIE